MTGVNTHAIVRTAQTAPTRIFQVQRQGARINNPILTDLPRSAFFQEPRLVKGNTPFFSPGFLSESDGEKSILRQPTMVIQVQFFCQPVFLQPWLRSAGIARIDPMPLSGPFSRIRKKERAWKKWIRSAHKTRSRICRRCRGPWVAIPAVAAEQQKRGTNTASGPWRSWVNVFLASIADPAARTGSGAVTIGVKPLSQKTDEYAAIRDRLQEKIIADLRKDSLTAASTNVWAMFPAKR
jgi:hypothetical protein